MFKQLFLFFFLFGVIVHSQGTAELYLKNKLEDCLTYANIPQGDYWQKYEADPEETIRRLKANRNFRLCYELLHDEHKLGKSSSG